MFQPNVHGAHKDGRVRHVISRDVVSRNLISPAFPRSGSCGDCTVAAALVQARIE